MSTSDNSDTSITIDQYIKDYKHEYPKPTVFTDSYTVKKAKAFTLAPVVKHNGIVHAVESFRFKSLSEMRNFADEHEFILYQTHIEIKLGNPNDELSEIELYDVPEVNYVLRAVALD